MDTSQLSKQAECGIADILWDVCLVPGVTRNPNPNKYL